MFKPNPYKKLSKYYDIFKAKFTDDLDLYLILGNHKSNILEIGCKTGRILKAFLEIGYSITGIDLSNEMLAIAEKKLSKYIINGKLKLRLHDFDKSPLNEKYDYVMITYYTFNYLLNSKKQFKFLKNVYETMNINSLIIFDLFYPKTLSCQKDGQHWEERLTEADGRKVLLKQRSKMINKIEKRVQYFVENDTKDKIITYRRYTTKEEIYYLLLKTGFSNILFTDGYNVLKGFHKFKSEEKTYSSFIVKAEKK